MYLLSIHRGQTYRKYSLVTMDELKDGATIDSLTNQSLKEFQFKPLGSKSCDICGALKFEGEVKSSCCSIGKVQLEPVKCPPALEELLSDKHYVENARKYNNALALASIGLKEILPPGYQPNFKIQGKTYHRIDPLTPEAGQERGFAQIYIHDSEYGEEEELNRRMEVSSTGAKKTRKDVMKKLQDLLHQINPYVKDFISVMNLPEEDVKELKIVLTTHSKPQPKNIKGRYNLPTCNEIALVALNEETGPADVVLYRKDGAKQSINNVHRCYDPLHYVLLFPHGEDGWFNGIKCMVKNEEDNTYHPGTRNISMRDFYAYRLQVRYRGEELLSPSIFRSGRLFQEYVVDNWAKIEAYKLQWVKNNQKTIRAETYKGLVDAINKDDDASNVGQRIILPASIYGSPRWYTKAFQDAMAAVRHYGAPDLFITFSCNPKSKAILDSLLPGQESHDRPDIVTRVYMMQMKEMIDDIVKNKVFGTVTSYFVVVEFQKRGLPHSHQSYTLADEDKPRTPEAVDKIVTAEIPEKTKADEKMEAERKKQKVIVY